MTDPDKKRARKKNIAEKRAKAQAKRVSPIRKKEERVAKRIVKKHARKTSPAKQKKAIKRLRRR